MEHVFYRINLKLIPTSGIRAGLYVWFIEITTKEWILCTFSIFA
jgi:hypothetical protein